MGQQQQVLSETICGLSTSQFFVALDHSILDGTVRLFTTRCHHNYFWLLLLPGRSLPPLRNHAVYTDKMCYPTFTVRIIIEKKVYSTDHLISFGRLRQDFSLQSLKICGIVHFGRYRQLLLAVDAVDTLLRVSRLAIL